MAKAAALTVTLLTLPAYGAFGTSTAEAFQILPKHHRIKDLPLKNQLNWYHKNINHAKTTLNWWHDHRHVSGLLEVRRHEERFHERLLRNATRNYRGIEHRIRVLRSRLERQRAKARAVVRSTVLGYPPHVNEWLCIHRYEGAWNANTGNGYYGGLQFGWSEWQRYGAAYGYPTPASAASPIQQMWAAEHYYNVSGFYPWPNTARMCGLI